MQYVHDLDDADEDGVLGFYELECERAPAGIYLDPEQAETAPGTPDGDVDCDHDGAINRDEVFAGTNLHPVLFLAPFDTGDPTEVGVALHLRQPDPALEPSMAEVFFTYDPGLVELRSAERGASATDAGKDLEPPIDVGAATVRIFLFGLNINAMQTGELARVTFGAIGTGDADFVFDMDATGLAPPAAEVSKTFGVGHPVEPLTVPVQE